ncbi:MAG TPA: CPBP family intramembrane glutamic endopeptidase [Intrasporangium sp.]|uniref:CPBP family intramembrane glutamic endopeptidase n=1 Tax=Intrasporangium sp. TaxID=1925024 RepID=UPI002D79EE92|nr:CPBP family intramembrane glutamic endopeptidase [Intrasporangium sp.]HET7399780.1 CPBP family intramembrane glutamic endopeptidase [Intrasporangium sp.]
MPRRYAVPLAALKRDPAAVSSPVERRGLRTETLLVLGVSLGASAVRSVLQIVERLTRPVPLAQQTAAMNTAVTPDRPWLDLAYQLVGIALALVPVLLALFLLARVAPPAMGISPRRFLGLDGREPVRDATRGLGLAALIGIPGLLLYVAAKALGVNTSVSAANLADVWWAVPVLVLAAAENAVLEEVVMVGYLFTRWRQVGWSWPVVIGVSAAIRGTYHLYQGFGGFAGNVAMGVLLGLVFVRTRRVLPLVVCHTLLDVVAFVGYTLLRARGVAL